MKETNSNRWFDDALLTARDPSWAMQICPNDAASCEEAEASVRKYFEAYVKGYRTTDFLLCVYEQLSMIPSDVFEWQGSKYLLREYCGEPVDFSWMRGQYAVWAEFGLDPVQICIDVMRENGVRPWLTLRMNDAHYRMEHSEPEPIWSKYKFYYKSDWYYEQLEAGHIIGPAYGEYMERCYNFAYPDIREKFVRYIEELLAKYDVFGIDLDFLREIYCLDYKNDPDCHKYMTEMIREIRAVLRRAETHRGHPVRLMVRLPRSIEEARGFGFDIVTWCREGLIDAVSPCARWECNDSGIPIRAWRTLLGEDIALFTGIETLHLHFTLTTAEQVKGYAAAGFAQGADGTYLYNYHNRTARDKAAWNLKREQVGSGKREFTVTFQDITSEAVPIYRPLPLTVCGSATLPLNIGRIEASDRVSVLIDYDGTDIPVLSVGTVRNLLPETVPPHIVPHEDGTPICMTPNRPLSYTVNGLHTENGDIILSFEGTGTISYVTVLIEH